MAPKKNRRETVIENSARRRLSDFLILAATCLVGACGGGATEQFSGGGGTIPGVCISGSTTTQLAWDPVGGAAGYRIYVGTAPGAYSQPFGQGMNVPFGTSASIPGLNPATTYHFAVTAYDGSGNESSYSNEVCKTTT